MMKKISSKKSMNKYFPLIALSLGVFGTLGANYGLKKYKLLKNDKLLNYIDHIIEESNQIINKLPNSNSYYCLNQNLKQNYIILQGILQFNIPNLAIKKKIEIKNIIKEINKKCPAWQKRQDIKDKIEMYLSNI